MSRDGVTATATREQAWLGVVALGVAGTAVYSRLEELDVKTAAVLLITGAGLVGVLAGIRLHRPPWSLGWLLLTGAASVWFLGWIFWQSYILAHDGAFPAVDSWRNLVFFALYPFFVGALLFLLRQREGGIAALVDTAIVGFSLTAVVWQTLLVKYLEAGTSTTVATVQIAFALGDIAILALLLRLVLSPGARTPAFWLLIASGACYLLSNGLWNWSTQLGEYAPGSWADAGWVLFPVGLAATALHPSMRSLFATPASRERAQSTTRVLLLAAAILIGPASSLVDGLGDHSLREVLVPTIAAGVVGILVVVRLALILRERQRLAGRLASQNEELVELDRLKDDFIASVSHELRTPLTSIRGYIDLVLEEETGHLNEEQRRFLAIVDRNADRLLRVVGDLLFVAQVGAGKMDLVFESVDVEKLVQHAADVARPHAESRDLTLVSEVAPLPPLRADRARLGQALDNLVSNAIKFTPAGGRVSLRGFAEGGAIVLEVSDTGMGISREEQERLFERFYRTPAAHEHAIQGTGLGLTIVQAIAEAHGGEIGLTSAHGAGTTFRILLPVAGLPSG